MTWPTLLLYACGHLCDAATGKPAPNIYASDRTGAQPIAYPCPQCPHPKPKRLPPRPYDELPMGGSDTGGVHR